MQQLQPIARDEFHWRLSGALHGSRLVSWEDPRIDRALLEPCEESAEQQGSVLGQSLPFAMTGRWAAGLPAAAALRLKRAGRGRRLKSTVSGGRKSFWVPGSR